MNYVFDLKLFIRLTIGFILFTIIGTVSHEAGHYLAATSLGYKARIHYGATSMEDSKPMDYLYSVYSAYGPQIKAGRDFPGREKFEQVKEQYRKDKFLITLGGVLSTLLTGTLGLLLLLRFSKSYEMAGRLSFSQWLIILIALFWLRPLANFATWLGMYLLTGHHPKMGDELKLAAYLQLPAGSVLLITAMAGAAVLITVTLRFVPVVQRVLFLLAGLLGGTIGYVLWLHGLGKYILP